MKKGITSKVAYDKAGIWTLQIKKQRFTNARKKLNTVGIGTIVISEARLLLLMNF